MIIQSNRERNRIINAIFDAPDFEACQKLAIEHGLTVTKWAWEVMRASPALPEDRSGLKLKTVRLDKDLGLTRASNYADVDKAIDDYIASSPSHFRLDSNRWIAVFAFHFPEVLAEHISFVNSSDGPIEVKGGPRTVYMEGNQGNPDINVGWMGKGGAVNPDGVMVVCFGE